jgi:hypothetical protein
LVVLVSGVAVVRNRELLDGRWDKHDGKDAANVADLIAQGKCLFYEYPDSPVQDLRVLLSVKMRLKKQEHGLRVRIRNHLVAQYFPELDRVESIGVGESGHCEVVLRPIGSRGVGVGGLYQTGESPESRSAATGEAGGDLEGGGGLGWVRDARSGFG